MVYVVYLDEDYEIDYPCNDTIVVGICSTKDGALNMIQEFGKRIEEASAKFGDKYIRSVSDDGTVLTYDLSTKTIKNACTVYLEEAELDKIISERFE